MLNITVSHYQEDLDGLKRSLSAFSKEIPFALAFTLTRMGQAGKAKATAAIPKYIDRPTRWTRGAVFLKPAKKTDLKSAVWIKDGSLVSLSHHVTGGQRAVKSYEYRLRQAGILRGSNQYTVPGYGIKLNQYGNISRGTINKILSDVGAQFDSSANSNSNDGGYFVLSRSKGVLPGIYKRAGRKSDPHLKSQLIFVKRTRYRRRFPFVEIAEDAAYDAMAEARHEAFTRIIRDSFKRK